MNCTRRVLWMSVVIKEAYDYFHAEYHAVSRLREEIAGWNVGVKCVKANSPGSDVLPEDSVS